MLHETVFLIRDRRSRRGPPFFYNGRKGTYLGFFAGGDGRQWILDFDGRITVGALFNSDNWRRYTLVIDGQAEGVELDPDVQAWLSACWRAAVAWAKLPGSLNRGMRAAPRRRPA